MKSNVEDLRSLKEQRDALSRQIDKLEKRTRATDELAEQVKALAVEKGVSLRELALTLDPELEIKKNADGKPVRAPRKEKKYVNPHTGETVVTKGGNNTKLKEWKQQWGASVVEGWVE